MSHFDKLDPRLQKLLWQRGWKALRPVQELCIPAVMDASRDVLIVASTAAGKTEAALLPALSDIAMSSEPGLVLLVSPLKALINDQLPRLVDYCDVLDLKVLPWHGDVSGAIKSKFDGATSGVLLITPESLEAILLNKGHQAPKLFRWLRYLVVDELHSFMGSERGKQLQSLMHRVEVSAARRVCRVGLSATIGDLSTAAEFLRPRGGARIIEAPAQGASLRIALKGYVEPLHSTLSDDDLPEVAPQEVAKHVFQATRDSNNLIFPNSRKEVERYTHLLNELSEAAGRPRQYWPHHGSLDKTQREAAETALKERQGVASAVCTNTLELGIDIGPVRSIVQVGPPASVSSLRQRLGRSGRREGEGSTLRGYVIEDALEDSSSLASLLRLKTVQMVSAIELMLEGWYETAPTQALHLSTLVQQLLSALAQNNGMRASDLYRLLCGPGTAFEQVNSADFATLLKGLGAAGFLIQDSGSTLLPGTKAEKALNHYSFYAAFTPQDEYRLLAAGKTLGTLPLSPAIGEGSRILFAGRTWEVVAVSQDSRTIDVKPQRSGCAPAFEGESARVHGIVRRKMLEVLQGQQNFAYLDSAASELLEQGRLAYSRLFSTAPVVYAGDRVAIATFEGDDVNEALMWLLRHRGYSAEHAGPFVMVATEELAQDVQRVIRMIPALRVPALSELLPDAKALCKERWDHLLPEELARRNYASRYLDIPGALSWLRGLR